MILSKEQFLKKFKCSFFHINLLIRHRLITFNGYSVFFDDYNLDRIKQLIKGFIETEKRIPIYFKVPSKSNLKKQSYVQSEMF